MAHVWVMVIAIIIVNRNLNRPRFEKFARIFAIIANVAYIACSIGILISAAVAAADFFKNEIPDVYIWQQMEAYWIGVLVLSSVLILVGVVGIVLLLIRGGNNVDDWAPIQIGVGISALLLSIAIVVWSIVIAFIYFHECNVNDYWTWQILLIVVLVLCAIEVVITIVVYNVGD
jgi:MFS family permease